MKLVCMGVVYVLNEALFVRAPGRVPSAPLQPPAPTRKHRPKFWLKVETPHQCCPLCPISIWYFFQSNTSFPVLQHLGDAPFPQPFFFPFSTMEWDITPNGIEKDTWTARIWHPMYLNQWTPCLLLLPSFFFFFVNRAHVLSVISDKIIKFKLFILINFPLLTSCEKFVLGWKLENMFILH
jgi:hypothetical protein